MPGITRASYIDSSKTSRAADFKDIKEAAKLEVEKANLPQKDRAAADTAIRELKKL